MTSFPAGLFLTNDGERSWLVERLGRGPKPDALTDSTRAGFLRAVHSLLGEAPAGGYFFRRASNFEWHQADKRIRRNAEFCTVWERERAARTPRQASRYNGADAEIILRLAQAFRGEE